MNVPENVTPESAQVLLDDLKAYQREQEDDPKNHLPPYHCGLIYAQLGDFASAVHSYQTALERNPEFGQAYFNMAIAYSNQELYEEAVQNYQQAIQYNPEDAEPWANLGALLQFQGKVDQASDAYRQSVTLNPNESEARRQMALMLYDAGREEEAEQVRSNSHPRHKTANKRCSTRIRQATPCSAPQTPIQPSRGSSSRVESSKRLSPTRSK